MTTTSSASTGSGSWSGRSQGSAFGVRQTRHVDGELGRILVRAATGDDVEAVLEVQRRSPGRSASARFRQHVTAGIADESVLVLIATVGPETVAWAMTTPFDESEGLAPAGYYLTGVTVAPEWRRKGVGGLLVQARLNWIGERDTKAFFFTNACNDGSIKLHERYGFRPVAHGARFRGVSFEGGRGILFEADLTHRDSRTPRRPKPAGRPHK